MSTNLLARTRNWGEMRDGLAKLLGGYRDTSDRTVTEEVSERRGVLLVRLGAGSAMQIRFEPNHNSVMLRTVPIGTATRLEDYAPWQQASELQLWAWQQSDSAIWHWLNAQGLDSEVTAQAIPVR